MRACETEPPPSDWAPRAGLGRHPQTGLKGSAGYPPSEDPGKAYLVSQWQSFGLGPLPAALPDQAPFSPYLESRSSG